MKLKNGKRTRSVFGYKQKIGLRDIISLWRLYIYIYLYTFIFFIIVAFVALLVEPYREKYAFYYNPLDCMCAIFVASFNCSRLLQRPIL